MKNKNDESPQFKDLSHWFIRTRPVTRPYDKFEMFDKAKKLAETFPDDGLWRLLCEWTELSREIPARHLDTLNETYHRCIEQVNRQDS